MGAPISILTMHRSRTGRKGPYAGYYVQIAPGGKTFVGQWFLFLTCKVPLSRATGVTSICFFSSFTLQLKTLSFRLVMFGSPSTLSYFLALPYMRISRFQPTAPILTLALCSAFFTSRVISLLRCRTFLIVWTGSGLWMPEAAPLSLLRAEIDRNSHRMKRVLLEPGIRKEMFGGIPGDEKKAVKAFVSQNGENALKTKPKVSTISPSFVSSSSTFFFLPLPTSNHV